jgi:hypothetical protein
MYLFVERGSSRSRGVLLLVVFALLVDEVGLSWLLCFVLDRDVVLTDEDEAFSVGTDLGRLCEDELVGVVVVGVSV